MDSQIRPRLVMISFALLALLNWGYVLWVKAQPIINNAWFVTLPLIGFFYFTFAFIALVWMYNRKMIGINLGYCVLVFGAAIDILSYSLIYQKDGIIELVSLPLVFLNFFVIFFIACNHKYFKLEP